MIIKEFLPNPVGSDQAGEYIKFLNNGPEAVLLNGWILKDASGKTYQLSGSLPAGQELALPYSQTKIALNNNGEKLFLYGADGKLADELGYTGQAEEGRIIQRLATSKLATSELKNEQTDFNLPITNYQLPTSNIIFLGFLIAVILAGLGLYIIEQLEKKLDMKLF